MDVRQWVEEAEECLRRVDQYAYPRIQRGEGREALGGVVGREGEDEKIGIDVGCQTTIRKFLLDERGLPARILSEHGVFGKEDAGVVVVVDPFDGSTMYKRMCPPSGWPHWSVIYSVLAIFDEENTPRVGGVLDFVERVIYLAVDGKVEVVSLEDGSRTPAETVRAKTLDEAVLASYVLDEKYARLTRERAGGLMETYRVPFEPSGGAFMGAMIAVGKLNVSGYVLGEELLAETAHHLPFIRAANLHVGVLDADGEVSPFEFDAHAWKNDPKGFLKNRMHVYLVAATEELFDAMVVAIRGA